MVLESGLGTIKLKFTLSCIWLKQLRKRYKAKLQISHLFPLSFAAKVFPKTGAGEKVQPTARGPVQTGSGAESKTLEKATSLSLETVQYQLQRGLEMCYMTFPELAFYSAFGFSECFGFFFFFYLKESMLSAFAICFFCISGQIPVCFSVKVSALIPCLKHRESTAPATKPMWKAGLVQQHHSPTWAGLMLVPSARARVLQVKPLLILQVFPRRTSLGASNTPEDAKGFCGSALAQSNNPFWGPVVEMPRGGRAHLLCSRSIFVSIMGCIFSANLYACHSRGYFS